MRTAYRIILLSVMLLVMAFNMNAKQYTDCHVHSKYIVTLQRHGLKADGVYGKVEMVLFPGGYATVSGSSVTFHYYTQDYLGNNRAVINGSTGAIEQTVAYYPYGGVIADLGTPTKGQPYKFGGKELITANGLNEYDFGARYYYSAVPHFTKPDPLCEDFSHLSPYLYCGNDPVNNADPSGKIFDTIWDIGNVLYDVGAAVYNHITGNHNEAKGNWVDAGVDAAAMIIPGVPAGASKLGKLAKSAVSKTDDVVDAVSSGKKAANGLKNADAIAEGRKFEQETIENMKKNGDDIATHVTLVPQNGIGNVKGNRPTSDIIKKNNDGSFSLIEVKRSKSTSLSTGQEKARQQIQNNIKNKGLFEIRSNKNVFNLEKGQLIKIDFFERINKYN